MQTEILYIHTNTPFINFKVVREALLIFLATKKPKDFSLHKATNHQLKLKDGHCILFFCPRTRPKTFLQCFALEQRESKAKHCRNVLGRVLGQKN